MDLVDTTIVTVGLPEIRKDLWATDAGLQWVAAGYALAFALMLITGGRLGDVFGRRKTFLAGIVGFTIASAPAGAAQGPETLIGARVLQGAPAAVMIAQVLTYIQVGFSAAERPRALGLYGMVLALAGVSGPLLGGLLIDAGLFGWDWRTIFLIDSVFLRSSEQALWVIVGLLRVSFVASFLLPSGPVRPGRAGQAAGTGRDAAVCRTPNPRDPRRRLRVRVPGRAPRASRSMPEPIMKVSMMKVPMMNVPMMNVQSTVVKRAGDILTSAIGSVVGAVADPKGALKQVKSVMSSPKPLAVAAGLVAAYALGWWRGHRAGSR
ncbi:hypothetical protein GCM10027161_34220 [Microbispora hainanensis]